jgi:hypothetical protein
LAKAYLNSKPSKFGSVIDMTVQSSSSCSVDADAFVKFMSDATSVPCVTGSWLAACDATKSGTVRFFAFFQPVTWSSVTDDPSLSRFASRAQRRYCDSGHLSACAAGHSSVVHSSKPVASSSVESGPTNSTKSRQRRGSGRFVNSRSECASG